MVKNLEKTTLKDHFNCVKKKYKNSEEFINLSRYVLKNVANYFSLKTTELFKNSRLEEIRLPRQIAQYQIYEENKKIFRGGYPNIIAKLFDQNHSTILNSCKKIDLLKKEKNTEFGEVLELLNFFEIPNHNENEKNNGKYDTFPDLEVKLKKSEFCKRFDYILRMASIYFRIPKKNFMKESASSLPVCSFFYQIVEENKEIFNGREKYKLIGKKFGVHQTEVRNGYEKINVRKNLNNEEGQKIRNFLNFFDYIPEKIRGDDPVSKILNEQSNKMKIILKVGQRELFRDIKKGNFLPYHDLYFYQIVKENKKILGHEASSLAGDILGINSDKILYSYHKIETLKNYEDQKELKNLLKLFENGSI